MLYVKRLLQASMLERRLILPNEKIKELSGENEKLAEQNKILRKSSFKSSQFLTHSDRKAHETSIWEHISDR